MDVLDAASVGKIEWKTIAEHAAWRSAPRPDWRGRTFPDDPWRIARWRERFFPGSYLTFELQEGKLDRNAHRIVFRSTALDGTDCATVQSKLTFHYGQPSYLDRAKYPQPDGVVVLDEVRWEVGTTLISFHCISGPGGGAGNLYLKFEPSGPSAPLPGRPGLRVP
jgi:hypothetical protein